MRGDRRCAGSDPARFRHQNLVAETFEESHQPARHLAVARRQRIVGRLQRRVQQHAHDYSAARAVTVPSLRSPCSAEAIQSTPAS